MKSALITGISGQDGSYLAELLLKKGYKVYGLVRRSSTPNYWRIEHILDKIELIDGDLLDQGAIERAIKIADPKEVYNLAAQSAVYKSFNQPLYTADATALGALRILEAIRSINPSIKFYQASSSNMFGRALETPQSENTPLNPINPYAIAKVFAHYTTINYRESYNMICVSGICFNHESPRRGLDFVTRKISDAVAKIYLGKQKKLILGNLNVTRDWGFAGDYVEAMWLMLQQDKPENYVIATGEVHSVEDFVREAFNVVGIEDWSKYVETSDKFKRPTEVTNLKGDYSKAKQNLKWEPKVKFKQLVKLMVESDLERNRL